jgi:hypothetical protein
MDLLGGSQWELCRSSTVSDGHSALGSSVVGTESVPGLGLTDTRVAPGYPSQTWVVIFSPLRRFSGIGSVWFGDRHQRLSRHYEGRVQRDRRVVTRMSSPSRDVI